jgi:hypothetical protein
MPRRSINFRFCPLNEGLNQTIFFESLKYILDSDSLLNTINEWTSKSKKFLIFEEEGNIFLKVPIFIEIYNY